MRLVDIPESERGQILREFPVKVPHGVTVFLKAGAVENASPEAFEAAARPLCGGPHRTDGNRSIDGGAVASSHPRGILTPPYQDGRRLGSK
jgi:hypothetical protein